MSVLKVFWDTSFICLTKVVKIAVLRFTDMSLYLLCVLMWVSHIYVSITFDTVLSRHIASQKTRFDDNTHVCLINLVSGSLDLNLSCQLQMRLIIIHMSWYLESHAMFSIDMCM